MKLKPAAGLFAFRVEPKEIRSTHKNKRPFSDFSSSSETVVGLFYRTSAMMCSPVENAQSTFRRPLEITVSHSSLVRIEGGGHPAFCPRSSRTIAAITEANIFFALSSAQKGNRRLSV